MMSRGGRSKAHEKNKKQSHQEDAKPNTRTYKGVARRQAVAATSCNAFKNRHRRASFACRRMLGAVETVSIKTYTAAKSSEPCCYA